LPISRAIGVNSAPVTYPEGRLTDGRTDTLTQLDLYLQWSFNLGETTRLGVTANVINVFDQDASTHVWNHMLLGGSSAILVPQDVYFSGYDYQAAIDAQGATRNAMFAMDNLFQAPRSVRLGVRLDF
jgi:outer membrane receptor protein involved in Fe transport